MALHRAERQVSPWRRMVVALLILGMAAAIICVWGVALAWLHP